MNGDGGAWRIAERRLLQLIRARDRLTGQGRDDVAAPLLEPIIQLIQQEGPEATAAKLGELFPQLDDDKLTELLTRALFVADMWGRIDAGQD